MTQEAVAAYLKTSQSHYWRMESGRQKPTFDNIDAICRLYGVSADVMRFATEAILSISEDGPEDGSPSLEANVEESGKLVEEFRLRQMTDEQRTALYYAARGLTGDWFTPQQLVEWVEAVAPDQSVARQDLIATQKIVQRLRGHGGKKSQ